MDNSLAVVQSTLERIKAGETINAGDLINHPYQLHWRESYAYLSQHPENANCLYYLGLLVDYVCENSSTVSAEELYRRSMEHGSLAGMYQYGRKVYCYNSPEGISWGLNALRKGYKCQTMDQPRYLQDTYSFETLTIYIEELRNELKEEKCRPPEKGGSDYEKAQEHFEENQ